MLEFVHFPEGCPLYSDISQQEVGLNHVYCWKSILFRENSNVGPLSLIYKSIN